MSIIISSMPKLWLTFICASILFQFSGESRILWTNMFPISHSPMTFGLRSKPHVMTFHLSLNIDSLTFISILFQQITISPRKFDRRMHSIWLWKHKKIPSSIIKVWWNSMFLSTKCNEPKGHYFLKKTKSNHKSQKCFKALNLSKVNYSWGFQYFHMMFLIILISFGFFRLEAQIWVDIRLEARLENEQHFA